MSRAGTRPAHPAFLATAMLLGLTVVWVRPGPAVLRGTDAACYARVAQRLASEPIAQWASPQLDGRRFDDHPPLGFWLEAAWMRAVGTGPAPAWRWAQVLATLLVLVVGLGGKRIGGPAAGGLAVAGLCILSGFLFESQNPMLELPLALGLAVGWVGAALHRESPRLGPALFVAGTAFAAWVKGPPALATFVALGWIAWRDRPPVGRTVAAAAAAVLVVAGGFGALELWRARIGAPAFLSAYLHTQLLPSALTGRSRAVDDPLYYLPVLGRWYLPALVLAPLALWPGFLRRATEGERRVVALGALLAGTVILGFTVPVQKHPWYLHAGIAGFAWLLGGLGAALVGDRLVRWIRPELVVPVTAVAVAWVLSPLPKHADDDTLYRVYAGERPVFTTGAPREVANCSRLGAWVADHSFALDWGARAVPCDAPAAFVFDGRRPRPAHRDALGP